MTCIFLNQDLHFLSTLSLHSSLSTHSNHLDYPLSLTVISNLYLLISTSFLSFYATLLQSKRTVSSYLLAPLFLCFPQIRRNYQRIHLMMIRFSSKYFFLFSSSIFPTCLIHTACLIRR